MKSYHIFYICTFALTIILLIVGIIVLPEEVITQFGFDSEDATVTNKYLAILIPTLLGVGGSAFGYFGDKGKSGKYMVIPAVGVIIFIVMIIVNI